MDGANKVVVLWEDAEIRGKVEELWAKVFKASNAVLKHGKDYGFLGMEMIPSPNIHDMLNSLKIISFIINEFIDSATDLEVDYTEIRLMLNAKEQVARMERVALALKANNRDDFDVAIGLLESQAPI